jgi:hypothetical protein
MQQNIRFFVFWSIINTIIHGGIYLSVMASKKGNTLDKVQKQIEFFNRQSTEKLLRMRNSSSRFVGEYWKKALNQVLKDRGTDIKNL